MKMHARWISALIVALSSSVALICVELGLRYFHIEHSAQRSFFGEYSSDKNYHSPSKNLGYTTTKGAYRSKLVTKFDDKELLIYDVLYTIERNGVRLSPNNQLVKSQLSPVLFIGDSFTFGEGLNDNETLPNQFSIKTDLKVENRGDHGYGPHQAFAVIQKEVDPKNYSFVIYQGSPWSSYRHGCYTDYSVGSPLYEFDLNGEAQLVGRCKKITESQKNIYYFLSDSKMLDLIISGLNIAKYNERNLVIENYIKFIVAMSRTSKNFIYLHIAPQPGWYVGTEYNDQKLINTLVKNNVTIINGSLTNELGFYKAGTYIPHDNHPTLSANQARASMLTNFIKNRQGS